MASCDTAGFSQIPDSIPFLQGGELIVHAKCSIDLHLKQKTWPKHVCKHCDIMGIDHGR